MCTPTRILIGLQNFFEFTYFLNSPFLNLWVSVVQGY